MMIPVPTFRHTRRNIYTLLGLGILLALLAGGLGALIYFLGYSRPDITQPFWESGRYVLLLCVVNFAIYAALFWQVRKLSRRPGTTRDKATVAGRTGSL